MILIAPSHSHSLYRQGLMGLAALLALLSPITLQATQADMPGVESPVRARENYILKCQGCHTYNARGSPGGAPAMNGVLATFLRVPGGREYLGQVPGVSTAALDDKQLAELLNWTLYAFDRENVPASFTPYTAEELNRLRQHPLRMETTSIRVKLQKIIKLNRGD